MKKALLAVLPCLVSLIALAQESELQSAAYYREHPFPSFLEIKNYVQESLDYAVTDGATYFTLAKKPDGYYLEEIEYGIAEVVRASYLCWSLKDNYYLAVMVKKTKNYSGVQLNIYNEEAYDQNIFYGYKGWYDDVIKLYKNEKSLNCDEEHSLAKAYDLMIPDKYFWSKDFHRRGFSNEQLQEVIEMRMLSIQHYEKSAELCPDKDRVVGSAVFKLQNVYMQFYYDFLILGYVEQAQQFLDKAHFEPFYVNAGKNMLNQCALNGVLFVGGDADTYICTYVQDKLNFRKDVVVINTVFCNWQWYLEYLKDIKHINTQFSMDFYSKYTGMYKTDSVGTVKFEALRKEIDNKSPKIVSGEYLQFPYRNLIAGSFTLDFGNSNYLNTYNIFLADLLQSNPSRPVYFGCTIPEEDYTPLVKYLSLEGLIYKVDPEYKKHENAINVNMSRFKTNMIDSLIWSDISLDKLYKYEKERVAYLYRFSFLYYIAFCANAAKDNDVVVATEFVLNLIPDKVVAYDRAIVDIIGIYYSRGDYKIAEKVAGMCAINVDKVYATYITHPKCTEELILEYYKKSKMAKKLSEIKEFYRAKDMENIYYDMSGFYDECK